MYRDGAARKVLGDRDFVFGDELTRDNLLKIAVTSDELREVNVYKVCVQPLDGDEFTVHVDVAAPVRHLCCPVLCHLVGPVLWMGFTCTCITWLVVVV